MREISKGVRFYLERRKKWEGDNDIPRPVILNFNYQGKSFGTTIGIKIADKNWDYNRQRVKMCVTRSSEVNKYFDKLSERINDIYFTSLSEGVKITNSYILKQLSKSQEETEPVKTFWNYYADFLETKRRVIQPSTYKSAVMSHNRFKDYCKSEGKLNIMFDDITPVLLAHYTDYLLRIGNTNNTIHSHFKRLRNFLNHSKKLNLHENNTYKEYHVPSRVGAIKFLNWDEVRQLMDVQLTSLSEQRARDLLLFACFTGMRHIDIRTLKGTDIKPHQFEGVEGVFYAAHFRQVKTSQETVVPLLPEAVALIEKYKGWYGDYALPQTNLQKVNETLKEVGKKAGLHALQKVELFRGTTKETSYIEKWRLLTTHIGRRTFVTLSATKGLPINIVASITGQNPATTMKHYMGVVTAEKFKEFTSKIKFT
ncbi:MAG: site-specific integrase [Bacteroidetes bacterium]|nr:site-specific integrase [Bacteroidota bacterium]